MRFFLNEMVSLYTIHWGNKFAKFMKFVKMARVQIVKTHFASFTGQIVTW
jgi:hypothetical protein